MSRHEEKQQRIGDSWSSDPQRLLDMAQSKKPVSDEEAKKMIEDFRARFPLLFLDTQGIENRVLMKMQQLETEGIVRHVAYDEWEVLDEVRYSEAMGGFKS